MENALSDDTCVFVSCEKLITGQLMNASIAQTNGLYKKDFIWILFE
jgi:hypothetical protein